MFKPEVDVLKAAKTNIEEEIQEEILIILNLIKAPKNKQVMYQTIFRILSSNGAHLGENSPLGIQFKHFMEHHPEAIKSVIRDYKNKIGDHRTAILDVLEEERIQLNKDERFSLETSMLTLISKGYILGWYESEIKWMSPRKEPEWPYLPRPGS